jgi:hypothetical protein
MYTHGYLQKSNPSHIPGPTLMHTSENNSRKSLSDLHQHPPHPADRSQTPEQGRDHRHSLFSPKRSVLQPSVEIEHPSHHQHSEEGKHGSESESIEASLWGIEDIQVISQDGDSVALLESSEEDGFYKNDSMNCVGGELG